MSRDSLRRSAEGLPFLDGSQAKRAIGDALPSTPDEEKICGEKVGECVCALPPAHEDAFHHCKTEVAPGVFCFGRWRRQGDTFIIDQLPGGTTLQEAAQAVWALFGGDEEDE